MKPPAGGRKYKPLFPGIGGIGKTVAGVGTAVKTAGVGLPKKVKAPVKPAPGPSLNDLFGLLDETTIEKMAHDSASSAVSAKAKAIDDAIQAEKDRTSYNVDLMRQVYAEFATFLQQGGANVQAIYGKAADQSAQSSKTILSGMGATAASTNAGINANDAAVNAPGGQDVSGNFGASDHIATQAQNFGDLLAAQGADWAAYMAVQPGIYSRMAVYNIGKLLADSTHRLALLQAQKVGLSDEEANAYADALSSLQKDQYTRRVDALRYSQAQDKIKADAANTAWNQKFKLYQEDQKNARFSAGLTASGLRSDKTAAAKAKTINASLSRETGFLTYNDGTPVVKNGKKIPVQGKGSAAYGNANITASRAAGRWVDGKGQPIPGLAGVPVPPASKGAGSTKTPPNGPVNREKDWGKLAKSMTSDAAKYAKGDPTSGTTYTYDQAFKLLTESYGWWVRKYGTTPALQKQLRTRLNNKIKRLLAAVGLKPGGTASGGGNTFTSP